MKSPKSICGVDELPCTLKHITEIGNTPPLITASPCSNEISELPIPTGGSEITPSPFPLMRFGRPGRSGEIRLRSGGFYSLTRFLERLRSVEIRPDLNPGFLFFYEILPAGEILRGTIEIQGFLFFNEIAQDPPNRRDPR